MKYQVFLTDDAAHDLKGIFNYIGSRDLPEKADYVLDQMEEVFSGLSSSPQRGTYPHELLALGMREYREVYFKPYRIIYRVIAERVFVMVIADGRRDMQVLLQRRLLQS